jgi:lysophospholipase L1-like esterase
MLKLIAAPLLALLVSVPFVRAQAPTEPPQVPLCMIGDSITWAQEGDWWRSYLVEQIPTLAFVGTHSAVLGYSHAGEGGNGTEAVLRRLPDIPDCPHYSLLIGTNDGSGKTEAEQNTLAQACAGRIVKIVQGLLTKPSVKKVFLGSILPCQTDNPLRDQTNSRVNAVLRPQISTLFPDGRVVWVEYEQPIRAIPNWGPIILLHPTKPGYSLIATILAKTLRDELKLGDKVTAPKPRPGAGVRVENLWQGNSTSRPIIAGWYTVSFDVKTAEADATLTLTGEGKDPKQTLALTFKVPTTAVGTRLTWNLTTGYAGYGYTTGLIKIATDKCTVDRVLFEKRRPSGLASVYDVGNYLDTTSPIHPGELVEK